MSLRFLMCICDFEVEDLPSQRRICPTPWMDKISLLVHEIIHLVKKGMGLELLVQFCSLP